MTEILLYGEVGWDFDAKWLASALDGADGDVTLRVHSPGGDVFEGVAISNAIRHARAQGRAVTAVVDGLAASAASYMCLTADRVLAGPGAVFMVHPPSGGCYGTADDMRETAQALDVCHETIRSLYDRRVPKGREAIDAAMRASTWMTAEDGVAWGLADAMDEGDAPDLSTVDSKWAGASRSGELAAFAGAHPALAERMDSIRTHSRLFEKYLLEARDFGIPAVDDADSKIPATDEDRDGDAEAADAVEGEAPAYAVANGHIYRIGNHRE